MKIINLIAAALLLTSMSTLVKAESDWTPQKTIRATQAQLVGQAVFVYTTGPWFEAGHRCAHKTVVFLTPDASGQEGFDQMFVQVMEAKSAGTNVRFGANGVCDEGPYFRATHMQSFTN